MSTNTPNKTPQNPVSIDSFAHAFSAMTDHSPRQQERAIHKLLEDMAEYRKEEVISEGEYYSIIGAAADIMQHYNFDMNALADADDWYRASVIQQMGRGMLQTIGALRDDLTLDTAYKHALSGMGIGQHAAKHLHCQAETLPELSHKWTGRQLQSQKSRASYNADKKLQVSLA